MATQVSIASIEAKSGLRFGDLASYDPMAEVDEGFDPDGSAPAPLAAFEEIRFTR
jgi:hypothetical protein